MARIWWLRFAAVAAAVVVASMAVLGPSAAVDAQTPIRDYPVPGGWFYSQESRVLGDYPPFRGFTVVDDADAAFWTEFRRFGGVEVLGYPVSRRYRYPTEQGYLHQAFQRGILQWRPEQGGAVLANVMEQFSEQGLDDLLEQEGIPRPQPGLPIPFEEDAARRMTWLTEPRFLARYLVDPVDEVPFESQEGAWWYFGLPQTYPERPVYLRGRENGKFGAPLYLPYIVQRFQKGALQLFLQDQPNDPTIVPGDGKQGCVSITAVGRLARRLGSGRIIPSSALKPEPPETPERVHFAAYIPPLIAPDQRTTQFELVGTGFDPGEPITVRLIPPSGNDRVVIPTVVIRIDQADPDGSFDRLVTARVSGYTVEMRGETSGKVLDPEQDPTIDLASPTEVPGTSRTRYC